MCYQSTMNDKEKKEDDAMDNIIDFKIFEDLDDEEMRMDRMTAALKYYQNLVLSLGAMASVDDRQKTFTAFCQEVYPKTVFLEDYIQCIPLLKDPVKVREIREKLQFEAESETVSSAITRHYAERRADNASWSWFGEKMDSLHFYLYHLSDVGLREESKDSEDAQDDDKDDNDELDENALKRLAKNVISKSKFFSSERLDGIYGVKNSKVKLSVHELLVFGFIRENFRNLIVSLAVEVQKLCVLFYYQQSPSLEAGYPLVYWPWYRSDTAQHEGGSEEVSQTLNGYTAQEMSVSPYFKNSKEEVLGMGLLTPQIFELFVVKKAAEYLKTRKVRTIKCEPFMGADDPLHYDIKWGSPLSPNHLHALILWCDFIKFRVKLIESLSGDNLENVKSENSKFFWVSRSLRELVAYFGSNGDGIKGPFYSALREVQNLSGFCIGFNIPTATTKILPVALRMAGSHGMVMSVGNQRGFSRYQTLFDTTWISTFFEEEEQLWFGSVYGLSVEDVFIMETARVYRKIIGALYVFDAAVSGQIERGMKVTEQDMMCVSKLLDICLEYALNGDKPDEVDDYILYSVKAFCAKKRKLTLSMFELSELHDLLQNMIFYGLSESESIPSDRTNIFRSKLFVQFPNVVQIDMDTMGYPVNLLSLLSVLDETNIPDCFQVLTLRDYDGFGRGWIEGAVDTIPDIIQQFKAKNWAISMETVNQSKRIIITRM